MFRNIGEILLRGPGAILSASFTRVNACLLCRRDKEGDPEVHEKHEDFHIHVPVWGVK